jgi:hypothetical protein
VLRLDSETAAIKPVAAQRRDRTQAATPGWSGSRTWCIDARPAAAVTVGCRRWVGGGDEAPGGPRTAGGVGRADRGLGGQLWRGARPDGRPTRRYSCNSALARRRAAAPVASLN